jgi:hypothetical protein
MHSFIILPYAMDRQLGSTVPVQQQDLHYIQEKTPNNPKKSVSR